MPEHTQDELQKLAVPALRHAELVQLARTKRPNEARNIAHNSGWPRRQVRAVKFLATLVRDYGPGALDALITSMEQVRAAKAAPEQAREKEKMTDRIRERLKLITDPTHKLRTMIEHQLHDDAAAYIEELIGIGVVLSLYHADGEKTVRTPADTGNGLMLIFENDISALVSCDFDGIAKTLGWSDDMKLRVIRTALERLSVKAGVAKRLDGHEVSASLRARRDHIPNEDPLAKKIELIYLRHRMQMGDVFELRRSLPIKMEHAENERHELDPIVDHLAELGFTPEEVRSLFVQWLHHPGGHYNNHFNIAIAGAKCFKNDDAERNAIVWESYILPHWSYYVRHPDDKGMLEQLHALLSLLNWESRRSRSGYFRSELVTMASEGKVSRAFQIAIAVGEDMGLLGFVNSPADLRPKAQEFARTLIPEAFAKAFDKGDYGVAAALVQHFGEDGCYNDNYLKQLVHGQLKERYAAVATEYADAQEAWSHGEVPDEYLEEGRGKEWQDALGVLNEEESRMLSDLMQQRRKQIGEVTQIAIDLKKPIRLEVFAYCHAPAWRND